MSNDYFDMAEIWSLQEHTNFSFLNCLLTLKKTLVDQFFPLLRAASKEKFLTMPSFSKRRQN